MDREIIAGERKLSRSRSETVYMRRSRAQMNKALTPAMLDAQREIEVAYRISAGHMGYVLSRFEDTPAGTGLMGNKEAWMQQQIKKLRGWEKSSEYSDIVLDIDIFAKPLQEMVDQRGVHKTTITRWYRLGLNDYCIREGMGDQINPRTIRDD